MQFSSENSEIQNHKSAKNVHETRKLIMKTNNKEIHLKSITPSQMLNLRIQHILHMQIYPTGDKVLYFALYKRKVCKIKGKSCR